MPASANSAAVLAEQVVLSAEGDDGLTGLLVKTVGGDEIGGVPGHRSGSEKRHRRKSSDYPRRLLAALPNTGRYVTSTFGVI
jgi:hypothetical protein